MGVLSVSERGVIVLNQLDGHRVQPNGHASWLDLAPTTATLKDEPTESLICYATGWRHI